jgi:exosome complex exonuclease RRP6
LFQCVTVVVVSFVGVVLNKKYQLADWRVRELPYEMLEYARMDTHYLLCVFDVLRKELFEFRGESALRAVFDMSRKTCLIRSVDLVSVTCDVLTVQM